MSIHMTTPEEMAVLDRWANNPEVTHMDVILREEKEDQPVITALCFTNTPEGGYELCAVGQMYADDTWHLRGTSPEERETIQPIPTKEFIDEF